VESNGPIVLGSRLMNSVEPRGWPDIVYGKGSWIMQMLRARMGDQPFFSMLAELVRRYDRQEVTTEQFRELAAQFLPPKSDDPKLELFFDQWVYGTGLPSLTMTYAVKGKTPALRLTGTVTQSGVDEEFSAVVPIEIQVARDRVVTQWVRAGSGATTFTVALKQAPLKVTLDPHYAVLRK
jgi:aminopeptidase N